MCKQIVIYDKKKWINVSWHLFIGFISSWIIYIVMQFFFASVVSVKLSIFITATGSFWLMCYQIIHYCILNNKYEYILFEFLDWPQYVAGSLTVLVMFLIKS